MNSVGLSAMFNVSKAVARNKEEYHQKDQEQLHSSSGRLLRLFKFRRRKKDALRMSLPPKGALKYEEFEVPSRPEMISHIRSRVVKFASDMDFDKEQLSDIELAVGEAGANALSHGASSHCDYIHVRIERYKKALRILIADKGCGFNPDEICEPSLDDFRGNGRGIAFMRMLMDEVKFHFDRPGTTVELIKRIK